MCWLRLLNLFWRFSMLEYKVTVEMIPFTELILWKKGRGVNSKSYSFFRYPAKSSSTLQHLILHKPEIVNRSFGVLSRSVVSDSLWPPWTIAHQAPLSMGFSRQEYCSGLPYPSPGDLPDPESKPTSPELAGGIFFLNQFTIWETPKPIYMHEKKN